MIVFSYFLTTGVLALEQSNYEPYPFSTFAGKGGALFGSLSGVATDSGGYVYVADTGNSTIRKISPAGAVTTLAGSAGAQGSGDGNGDAAQFYRPEGLTADSAGNIYVADTNNHTIRKINSAGDVTTIAGLAGNSGSADDIGTFARFNGPAAIAIDSAGNLYVADTGNNTIRKILPAGDVITLAGLAGNSGSSDGNGTSARFSGPCGVAVDTGGNVYVADRNNNTIRKITSAGDVTTLAGLAGNSGSANGNGTNARFNSPSGVAVDSAGNLYVPDTNNQTIRKISPVGDVSTLAGSNGLFGTADSTGSAARFFYPPGGVAVNSAGVVYVSDYPETVRKITPAGVVTTFAGSVFTAGSDDGTGGNQRFGGPPGYLAPSYVAVDHDGYVYATENNAVAKVSPSGFVTILAGAPGPGNFGSGYAEGVGGAAQFNSLYGIAVDSSGNVYVSDNGNLRIRKITAAGNVTTLVIAATGSPALLAGLAVDSAGFVYLADAGRNAIFKITPAGAISTFVGNPSAVAGSVDGTGTAARFRGPSAVAVDSAGYLYVADTKNHTIRKVTPAGVVSTFVGTAGFVGSADGTGSAASFRYPVGVTLDGNGNLYVADNDAHTIRKITAAGLVTTLAGLTGVPGNVDGVGSAARFGFFSPNDVAVDTAGYVYVADSYNQTIRVGGPAATATPPPTPTPAPTPTPTPAPSSEQYYFASSSYEAFKNAGSVTITVNRSGDISQAASVTCATDATYTLQYNLLTYGAHSTWYSASTGDAQFQSAHQAIAGQDYTSFNGTANFQPNESSTTVSITLLNNSALSGRRDFNVVLKNGFGQKIGSPAQVFILDDQTTLQISSGNADSPNAPNPDYTRNFTGNLKVVNSGSSSTGPLRIKLVAHADYNNPPEHPITPTPTPPSDIVLGTFDLTPSLDGFGGSASSFVYGVTPAPGGNPYSYNYWWWVYGVVEEQVGSVWHEATSSWLLISGARFATGLIAANGNFQNYGTPCPAGQSCDNGGSTGSTGSWGGSTNFLAGGQPFVIASIAPLQNGHYLLKGIGKAKDVYSIKASTSPSGSSFLTIGSATVDSTGLFKYEDTNAGSFSIRFYRATSP